jgi:hypothetical protein
VRIIAERDNESKILYPLPISIGTGLYSKGRDYGKKDLENSNRKAQGEL